MAGMQDSRIKNAAPTSGVRAMFDVGYFPPNSASWDD
jgi:hypothetical protein